MRATDGRPDPAAQPQLGQRQILIIMTGLMLGMFLAALDQTIVATALPTIAGDLHSLSRLSWVVTAYLLASTVSTPLWGKLGDQYGRKIFFQAAIVIFLIGSALAGLSQTMTELIIFRAIQGIGGGGLMVGAQTIIGDVVPPRERGRYQGFFGAVFGVTSVVGPLIGGFFVDNLSWRWVFYVNLPIGVIALIVVAAVLPGRRGRGQHSIDYLGTVMIGGAASSLVLLTSLGGVTYPWGSGPVITLGVLAVVFAIGFVVVERRAAEPVLPLHLFRHRVFSAAGAIGFVVGFAMFGALTYLPQYFQVVRGVSPTISGLRLLPLMAGLLLTSIGTGQLITRRGRYKVFPVFGTAVMTVGPLPALASDAVDGRAVLLARHVPARRRDRRDDAGARDRRAERRRLLGPGRRHIGHDLLPVDRRLVRHQHLRRDLRSRAARQHHLGPARARAAARRQPHRRRQPRRAGQAPGADPCRSRRRLLGVDPYRLPGRRPGRGGGVRLVLDAEGTAAAQDRRRRRPGRPAGTDVQAHGQDLG